MKSPTTARRASTCAGKASGISVADHATKETENSLSSSAATDPLDFSDWLSRRGNDRQSGWLVVGEVWQTEDTRLSTFSYLVSSDTLQQRLCSLRSGLSSAEVEHEIVDAFLNSRIYGSKADPDDRDDDSAVAADKRPFVIETSYHGYRPLDIALVDAFVLFWNAFWEGGMLQRIDEDGELHNIARKAVDGKNVRLEVDIHHLRSFLAMAKAGLLRIHDHTRFSSAALAEAKDGEYNDATGRFEYGARNYDFDLSDRAAFSRLMGKDVVEPYRDMKEDPRFRIQEYERFIVGRRHDGSEDEASSDESLGEAEFLTAVYFRAEVLRKYYDAPDRYTVEIGLVRCLSLWSIPIDRRADDLVQVWLGDLGRIPQIAQRHWRAYNVAPPGTGISAERFKRDFEGEWFDPKGDIAFDFQKSLRRLDRASALTLGATLYRPPSEDDRHALKGLRMPVSDSPEESDAQIIALAKITADTFDNDLLRHQIDPKTDVKDLKSVSLLEKMLQEWNVLDLCAIITPYRELWAARSTGAAHRRGSGWERTLAQGSLIDLGNKELVAELMRRVTRAQELLSDAMERRADKLNSSG